MKNRFKIAFICTFLVAMFIPTVYAYWTDKVESKVNITITRQGYLDVLDVSDPDPEPVPVPEGDLQNEGEEDVIQSSGSDSGEKNKLGVEKFDDGQSEGHSENSYTESDAEINGKENNTREQR